MKYFKLTTLLIACLLVFVITGCEKKTSTSSLSTSTVEKDKTQTNNSTTKGNNSSTTSSSTTVTITRELLIEGLPFITPYKDESSINILKEYYKDFNKLVFDDLDEEDLLLEVKNILNSKLFDSFYSMTWGDARDNVGKVCEYPKGSGQMTLFFSGDKASILWSSKADSWKRSNIVNKDIGHFKKPNNNKHDDLSSDLHNIRPCDYKTNEIYQSLDKFTEKKLYDEIKTSQGTFAGTYDYGDFSYQPIKEIRGDIARILMYCSAKHYLDLEHSIFLENFTANGKVDILLKWNKEDPVSDEELSINNEIAKIQGNRNIFIDFPELADLIWG